MQREPKYHIRNTEDQTPLCWDDKLIEFDTEEAAKKFIEEAKEEVLGGEELLENAIIEHTVYYYEEGYIRGESIDLREEEYYAEP